VATFVIVLALVGPENHGRHFERAKMAFQAGASKEDVDSNPGKTEHVWEGKKERRKRKSSESGSEELVKEKLV